jgi:broad specificity phosphatase PhoE
MRSMKARQAGSLTAVAALSGLLLAAAGCAAHDYDVRYDRDERAERGRRYQTMRALAHELDERAERAFDRARESAYGGKDERRFRDSSERFARRAAAFHERVDRYEGSRWDVPSEVRHLNEDARDVGRRIRDARVSRRAYDDWDGVLDTLGRMNRLVEGNEWTAAPPDRDHWRGDRDDR